MAVGSNTLEHPVAHGPTARVEAEPQVAPDGGLQDEVMRVPDGGLTVAARHAVTIASEGSSLVLTAATEIVLNVGQSTLTLRADGTILLNGRRMTLSAPGMIDINPDAESVAGAGVAATDAPRACGCHPCGCMEPDRAPAA